MTGFIPTQAGVAGSASGPLSGAFTPDLSVMGDPQGPPLRQNSLANPTALSRAADLYARTLWLPAGLGRHPLGLYARTLCAFWLENCLNLGVISLRAPTQV
jgi:hypothetical protein